MNISTRTSHGAAPSGIPVLSHIGDIDLNPWTEVIVAVGLATTGTVHDAIRAIAQGTGAVGFGFANLEADDQLARQRDNSKRDVQRAYDAGGTLTRRV